MRPLIHLCLFVLAAPLLIACTPQEPAIEVNSQVGRECFERHLTALPPGAQFEGIERAVAGRLSIRVMTGVDLKTLECGLNPDGSLKHEGP